MKTYEDILETKAGITVKLIQDEYAQNPRTDCDNFGTMVCFHRRHNLGDKHNFSSPEDFREWWKANGKGGTLLSLYLYDHSGITMSCQPFSCPWDSGQVGWIYATAEMIRKEYSCKRITKDVREKVRKLLNCEVETYDQFLTGDVWGYVVEDEDGDLDSCWGFYGSDFAKEEALSSFKHYVEKAESLQEHTEGANSSDNLSP